MYIFAAIGIPLFALIVYKVRSGKNLSTKQFFSRVLLYIQYYIMGVRENIEDIVNRSQNHTDPVLHLGEIAVVTGGSRGLGLEVVKKLLQCNMTVIIGCRNLSAGQKALEGIMATGVDLRGSKCFQLDLASMRSIKTFADQVLDGHQELHLLVNNAGVMITPFELTEDGYESQFQTNYLGHCYLTHLLLPRLAANARMNGISSRIVNVSSCIHYLGDIHFDDLSLKDDYLAISAYGQSKLAQVLFTKGLEMRLRAAGIPVQVHAVHPGVANTDIFDGSLLKAVAPWLINLLFKTPEAGARSILHACVSLRLSLRGGMYITNCAITQPGGRANDMDLEKRLWNKMLELLGVESFGGLPAVARS